MSEYNKAITIEIRAFGPEKEPCDIVPILDRVIDDIIERGRYVSGYSGLYRPNSFMVEIQSTCLLVAPQPSVLKHCHKLAKRFYHLILMTVLKNVHGFLLSIQKRLVRRSKR